MECGEVGETETLDITNHFLEKIIIIKKRLEHIRAVHYIVRN